MNYIGSKFKLLAWIDECIVQTVGDNLSDKVFCDIFAGTGIVGRHFKQKAKKIISNDIEYYSYVLNKNYIYNHQEINYKDNYIEQLNMLKLVNDGFIYNNYCMGSGSNRQYFSDENGKKIDSIRIQIEKWKQENLIDDKLYYFLLASLLESADKVANTASVYGAYLKHIKLSAQKSMILTGAQFSINDNFHEVYCEDANSLIYKINGDILYIDPPYNHRQYGANYHLLNTISLYDEFVPIGKTGMRNYIRSTYCQKQHVAKAFDCLIQNAQFKYIFVSYNNEGIMNLDLIKNIMKQYGHYQLNTKEYQRFRADKISNRNHKASNTYEYLHILEKY